MSDTPNPVGQHSPAEHPNPTPVGLPPLPTNPSVEAVESFRTLVASLDTNALDAMVAIHANIAEPSNMITVFSDILNKETASRVRVEHPPVDPV
jgi:hypothetical protein